MRITLRACLGILSSGIILTTSTPRAAQAAGAVPQAGAAPPVRAATTRISTNAPLGLTAIATEIELPPGQWGVTSVAPAGVLDQIFLTPLKSAEGATTGRRMLAAQTEKNIQSGSMNLWAYYSVIGNYARAHGGRGPAAFTDLNRKQARYLLDSLNRSPFPEDAGRTDLGPMYFLVPSTPIFVTGRLEVPTARTAGPQPAFAPRVPLILELRPYVDDGKHWVLFSNGTAERRAVDQALLAKYHLTLSFARSKTAPTGPPDPKVNSRHAMVGLLRGPNAATATVALADAVSARRLEVRWALAGGRADSGLVGEWARARAREWRPLLNYGDASILQTWMARSQALYPEYSSASSAALAGARVPPPTGFDPTRTTDVFGVLGGRAALRETLQMQLLRAPTMAGAESPTVPVSTLRGVDVKSLPFDRMLAGKPGGQLALANLVPADRLFLYFAKPSAVFPLLDSGGSFLAKAGSLLSSSDHDDDLKGRYLRRLGLMEGAGRKFLESGEVTELAIVTPDLFFIDGTDITIVMRVRSPDAVAALLRLLGIVDLKDTEITEKPTSPGRAACWARHGDVFALSTSRGELSQVLKLAGGGPATESLGRSAEFRYMLTELPLKPESRALIYLSDPFIRRMVGPALKIGQLRRMRARADMGMITAGALLAKLDGRSDWLVLTKLIDLGYVPRTVTAGNYRLREDGSVVSPRWGTPAEMTAIDSASIETVTTAEAEAYQNYMNQYREYWRQYFDPIGMRLDDAPGGALELSTFILPLVDSQLYNQVRGMLETREHGTALRIPVVAPEPVFQLSLNMTDASWISVASGWSSAFSQYTGIDPAIFDVVGPGLHIALQDADPIIATGTADLLGSFGGAAFGRSTDFWIPMALSILTRPCKVLVELQDPERALDLLRRSSRRGEPSTGGMAGNAVSFRQVDGRDAWIYTLGLPGITTIRFGLEVQNGFLVFSNIPWSQPVTVTGVESRPLNGAAIQVTPDAVRQGLAGLFATQAEQNQLAALASMASLLPLLQTVSATPEEAASAHAALFGSRPLHPGQGSWVWRDGRLESSVYGSVVRWKEPIYKPEMGTFGLFDGTMLVDLNMQFEAGGLRAVCRWIWNDTPGERK